jgi:hypothetical protein
LILSGINTQLDAEGNFTQLGGLERELYDLTLKNTTILSNGSPISNLDMMQTLANAKINTYVSSVNPNDFVGEVTGANAGNPEPYINRNVINTISQINSGNSSKIETNHLNLFERFQRIPNIIPIGIGDPHPIFENGQQTNTVSPHSTYRCQVNCGNDGQLNAVLPSSTDTGGSQ